MVLDRGVEDLYITRNPLNKGGFGHAVHRCDQKCNQNPDGRSRIIRRSIDMQNGYFLVPRFIFGHPIWLNSTPEQKTIFMVLLNEANFVDNTWEFSGRLFNVKRGQMITSLDSLASKCGKGISVQNVRTALKRFEKLGIITNESTNTGRLITICYYDEWQNPNSYGNKATNNAITMTPQADNSEVTPNNKGNEGDEGNKVSVPDTTSSYLQGAVSQWASYRADTGNPLADASKSMLADRLYALADKYGEKAVVGLIEDAIISGYKTIPFDRLTACRPVPKVDTEPVVPPEPVDPLTEDEKKEYMAKFAKTLAGMSVN